MFLDVIKLIDPRLALALSSGFYDQQEAQTSKVGKQSSAQLAGAQSQLQVADAERVNDPRFD